MGKRSDFDRIPRDFYPTPWEAVVPLLPHIGHQPFYIEPCVGEFHLVEHLMPYARCVDHGDIVLGKDAMSWTEEQVGLAQADYFITNPPWDRKLLHPMIGHLSALLPTWLLFDADWIHTKQSAPFLPWLRKIVAVGRVKWIPDSKMTGKDNCAWHLFDQKGSGPTVFVGRQE